MHTHKAEKPTDSISVRLPMEVIKRIRGYADDEMRTLSSMAGILIRRGLEDMDSRAESSPQQKAS